MPSLRLLLSRRLRAASLVSRAPARHPSTTVTRIPRAARAARSDSHAPLHPAPAPPPQPGRARLPPPRPARPAAHAYTPPCGVHTTRLHTRRMVACVTHALFSPLAEAAAGARRRCAGRAARPSRRQMLFFLSLCSLSGLAPRQCAHASRGGAARSATRLGAHRTRAALAMVRTRSSARAADPSGSAHVLASRPCRNRAFHLLPLPSMSSVTATVRAT